MIDMKAIERQLDAELKLVEERRQALRELTKRYLELDDIERRTQAERKEVVKAIQALPLKQKQTQVSSDAATTTATATAKPAKPAVAADLAVAEPQTALRPSVNHLLTWSIDPKTFQFQGKSTSDAVTSVLRISGCAWTVSKLTEFLLLTDLYPKESWSVLRHRLSVKCSKDVTRGVYGKQRVHGICEYYLIG